MSRFPLGLLLLSVLLELMILTVNGQAVELAPTSDVTPTASGQSLPSISAGYSVLSLVRMPEKKQDGQSKKQPHPADKQKPARGK